MARKTLSNYITLCPLVDQMKILALKVPLFTHITFHLKHLSKNINSGTWCFHAKLPLSEILLASPMTSQLRLPKIKHSASSTPVQVTLNLASSCQTCRVSFATLDHLRLHSRLHDGGRHSILRRLGREAECFTT